MIMGRAAELSTAGLQGKHLSSTRLYIPTLRKTSRQLRRAAWQNRKLMGKVHRKKEAYRRWMQGLETKEEFRNTVGFRARAPLGLTLPREFKGTTMSCYYLLLLAFVFTTMVSQALMLKRQKPRRKSSSGWRSNQGLHR